MGIAAKLLKYNNIEDIDIGHLFQNGTGDGKGILLESIPVPQETPPYQLFRRSVLVWHDTCNRRGQTQQSDAKTGIGISSRSGILPSRKRVNLSGRKGKICSNWSN
jgi:hypothetical protein